MTKQTKTNREEISREKAKEKFIDLMQDIKDNSYQAESLLRGIQALADGMMCRFEKDPWEPFHIAGISESLEKVVRTIGDKAQEADTFFHANVKGKLSTDLRAPEGRV